MNIGVLGGTFNPIHNGHIIVAEEVLERLDLAEVLFVPAGKPWLKQDSPVLAAEHRLHMVQLAVTGKSRFRISTMEIDRAGPSYTVDTMAELHAKLDTADELFFIMGWDSLAQLPQWREPNRLIKLCYLVAVPRPGYPLPDLDSLEAVIPGLLHRLTVMRKPEVDISSTDIRERIIRGLPISHLVPEPVEEYIRRHGLYLPC